MHAHSPTNARTGGPVASTDPAPAPDRDKGVEVKATRDDRRPAVADRWTLASLIDWLSDLARKLGLDGLVGDPEPAPVPIPVPVRQPPRRR